MPVESGLQLYLNQINHVPLLTAEREKELDRHMKMSIKKVRIIHRAVRAFHSPTQAHVNEDDGMALHEMLHDERTPTPDNIVLGKDEIRTIYQLLSKIDQREAEILKLRF